MKELRAKGHYSREEIKMHMKQYGELMKMKASESRQSHLAQIRALRKKNKELQDEMSQAGRGMSENDSLESLHSPAAKSKHRKRMEALDAMEYKVHDDARERKMKHKKLMDMISPTKGRKMKAGAENTPQTPPLREERPEGEDITSPRSMLSPRTRESLANKRKQTPGNIDIEPSEALPVEEQKEPEPEIAVEDIDRLVADHDHPSESIEIPNITVAPPPPETPKREEINPFMDIVPGATIDIPSQDIPTFLAADWMERLQEDPFVDQLI